MNEKEIIKKLEAAKNNKHIPEALRQTLIDKYEKQLSEIKNKTAPFKSKQPKKEKPEVKKTPAKKQVKAAQSVNYDCDDLIKKAQEKRKKAKLSAEKTAKKTEGTKAKEKIERTHEAIEKQISANKFTKVQLQKLIMETKHLLALLQRTVTKL
jgi:hypothetical protein